MKKTKRKGLSFLELVIAMTLTFLSITFLMGLFITSIRNGETSKKRTTAAIMAHSTLERLSAFTADQIPSTTAHFDPPMQDYTYNVDIQPAGDYTGTGTGDDPDLKQVICTVTDPSGNSSTLVALRQAATPLYGLVASHIDDNLVFTQNPVNFTQYQPISCNNTTNPAVVGSPYDQSLINWYPSTVFLDATQPQMPNNGKAGAICSNPDLSAFCAVDLTNLGIRFISSSSPTWSTLAKPTGIGHPSGVTGKVGSPGTCHIFLGDDKNRCLWEYKQSTNSWTGPLTTPGMGRIASLSSDDLMSSIWVVDVNAKGLRKYDLSSGTWSQYLPDSTLPAPGNLVGLAVSGNGKKVFTCDEQTLYILDVASGTWSVPPSVLSAGSMPSKLTSDIPQALAANMDGSKLWANPVYGSLYYYDVTNDIWSENYIP
ncbi:hypothetical protein JST97_30175 [bacterium]|nr:hypothetical protein [bacterium]